jgi:poly(A) polymerase
MDFLEKIKEYADEKNIDMYMVGGAVRDKIMGKPIADYDFAVCGDCHAVAKEVASLLQGSYINMHEDVGRVVVDHAMFDFCNLKGKDIEEDLRKRDFTINSIGINIRSGKMVDVTGGIEDINKKIIKHTYENSFDDDPLRLLRAVRLSSSLDFKIDEDTKRIIKEKSHLLSMIAGERILDELYKILESKKSHIYFKLLDHLNLLEVIFPVIGEMKKVGKCRYHVVDSYTHSILTLTFLERNLNRLYYTKWGKKIEEKFNESLSGRKRLSTVKLGAFLHDIGKPAAASIVDGRVSFRGHDITGREELNKISSRLHMSNQQKELIKAVITGHMRVLGLFKQGASDRAIYRLFRDLGDNTIDVLVCSLFDVTATRSLLDEEGEGPRYWNFVMRIIDKYYTFKEKEVKLITGREVMELTGAKGSEIGKILKKVEEEFFYGNIKTKEDAKNFVKLLWNDRNKE